MTNPHMETAKHAMDVASITVGAAALLKWLPPIASGLTIIWMMIRIWESDTVQNFIKKRFGKK